jgi:hypothetical protein
VSARIRPSVGERVSFARGIQMSDGVVRHVGASMFAIEPDDPSQHHDLDREGRVWRYEHELAGLGTRPSGDVVVEPAPDPLELPETVSDFAFGARFPGTCPGCDLPIVVGQSVRRTSHRRYVHERCTP